MEVKWSESSKMVWMV